MIKKLLALFLISQQAALAGLPPTTIQGQADSAASTKFSFQVPNSEYTNLGGIKALIETGNTNLLLNAGFENTTATTSWTTTTATSAVETTTVVSGKQALKTTFSSSTGNIAQSVTPSPAFFTSVNMQASCWVNTTQTTIQVCPLTGGTEVAGACVSVPGSGQWQNIISNFIGPASGTSMGVEVKTTSSISGNFTLDDCYVGPAQNLGAINNLTSWTNYTPTLTGFGTVSSANAYYRRVGDSMEVKAYWVNGTVAASVGTISLPTGFSVNTGALTANKTPLLGHAYQMTNSGTPASLADAFAITFDSAQSTTAVVISSNGVSTTFQDSNGSTTSNTSFGMSAWFTVPISGWVAETAVRADQTDFPWTSYTPTFSAGFGTVTNTSFFYRRVGDSMLILGKLTLGTVAASVGTITLPNSLTSNSTVYPTVKLGGIYARDTATANVGSMVVGSGTNTLTLSRWSGTENPLSTSVNMSSIFNSNENVSFTIGPIAITGWTNTQGAPLLVGSITSSSTNSAYHLESFNMGTSVCSTATCTLTSNTAGISSVTRSATGTYAINFVTGTFSGEPVCTPSVRSSSLVTCDQGTGTLSSTTAPVACDTSSTGVAGDASFGAICMGSR